MKQRIAELFNLFYGLRKTIAWFSLFLIAIVFRLKGYINGDQFTDLLKSTFTGFVAGNSIEHLVSFGKEYVNSKNSQVADTDESNDNKEVTPVVENNG